MQLTRFTDYSLRVLMHLAYRRGELCTISEIATAHSLSENHLMKVVHRLATSGYVETLRGKGGGMRLGRPAEQIGVGAVVRDMEGTIAAAECLVDGYAGGCRMLPGCKLQGVLRDAQRAFLHHLDQFTLADLLQAQQPAATIVPLRKRPAARR
jgi:Rrf2 family nitric oxide-sensitive transcriptional repressor